MIKRYDLYDFSNQRCPSEMMPHPDGGYVTYNDYEKETKMLIDTLQYIISLRMPEARADPTVPELTYKELEVKLDDAIDMAKKALKQ